MKYEKTNGKIDGALSHVLLTKQGLRVVLASIIQSPFSRGKCYGWGISINVLYAWRMDSTLDVDPISEAETLIEDKAERMPWILFYFSSTWKFSKIWATSWTASWLPSRIWCPKSRRPPRRQVIQVTQPTHIKFEKIKTSLRFRLILPTCCVSSGPPTRRQLPRAERLRRQRGGPPLRGRAREFFGIVLDALRETAGQWAKLILKQTELCS